MTFVDGTTIPHTKESVWIEIAGKLILLAVFLKWTYELLLPANIYPWIFLDFINLAIHEAGHLIFGLFGEFMGILGGSLNQLIFPAAFLIYFLVKAKWAGVVFCIFWLGNSLINLSYYIKDASSQQLPLLADGLIHDWNWLLTTMDLLAYDQLLGTTIHIIGVACIVTSLLMLTVSAYYSYQSLRTVR